VIARDGYRILAYALDSEGRCKSCGAAVAGRFSKYEGAFGPRRIPVRLAQYRPATALDGESV
jgi:pyruvate formate lyase activating enzyme